MTRRRLHMPAPGEQAETIGASLCGRAAVVLVYEPMADCRDCARVAAALATRAPRAISLEEALRDLAHLLSRPALESYPTMTPSLYRQMSCRRGAAEGAARARQEACSCAFCLIDRRNRVPKAQREAEDGVRPHRAYAHPLGSLQAALELLVRHKAEPVLVRSSTGSAMSRLLEAAALGAAVQTTRRHDRDDLPTRRTQLTTDIERAVWRSFARAEDCRGLEARTCVGLLLDSVDTGRPAAEWAELLGVSAEIVRNVVRHGRRATEVELAALRLIPEPSPRKRLAGAIEARRRQLTEADHG